MFFICFGLSKILWGQSKWNINHRRSLSNSNELEFCFSNTLQNRILLSGDPVIIVPLSGLWDE